MAVVLPTGDGLRKSRAKRRNVPPGTHRRDGKVCTTGPDGSDGNISIDPNFVKPAGGNDERQNGSPAINTGTRLCAGLAEVRTSSKPRTVGGTIDMGAYENQTREIGGGLRLFLGIH